MKRALITGITGQDGSYLAELLLEKGYKVYGIMRRKSNLDLGHVEHIKNKLELIYGDMTDPISLINAVKISMPDEVYNLAAQSFVATSWEQPIATADIDAIGVTNILEAIRNVKPSPYQKLRTRVSHVWGDRKLQPDEVQCTVSTRRDRLNDQGAASGVSAYL